MKVYELVARALKECMEQIGTETLFGVMGDANMFMVDDYVRNGNGNYVRVAHEAAAVAMAISYAQIRDTVGVATVTQGPGLTNAVTALLEGVKSRTPMVLLTGDTAEVDISNIQFIDQREVVKSAQAGFEQLRSPATIAEDLVRAFRRAWLEQRPVVFNMPYDYQWLESEYEKCLLTLPARRSMPELDDNFDNALGMAISAKKPVILAGRGAVDARQALEELAELLQAPLATTIRAKNLFDGNPYDLGICGTLSNDVANEVLSESDCIIAFGAGLNKYTGGLGAFFTPDRKLVLVSQTTNDIGRYVDVDAGIIGDPGLVASEMARQIKEAGLDGSGFRTEELKSKIAQGKTPKKIKGEPRKGTVDIVDTMQIINKEFPADRVYLTDGGRYEYIAWTDIAVQTPKDYVHTICFGAIGLGLPMAIGAAIASDRPTLLMIGDGGLELGGVSEFFTALREAIDLVVFIFNDGSYGAEHEQFVAKDMDPGMSLLGDRNFTRILQAMDVPCVRVTDMEELQQAMTFMHERDRKRPHVIEVMVDPDRMNR